MIMLEVTEKNIRTIVEAIAMKLSMKKMFDVAMKMTVSDALLRRQESLGFLRLWFIEKLERFFSNEISKEITY